MVNANGVAIFLLTAASAGTVEQARAERSWFGKKINKADYIRVQEDRLRRLEERIEKMRCGLVYRNEQRNMCCTKVVSLQTHWLWLHEVFVLSPWAPSTTCLHFLFTGHLHLPPMLLWCHIHDILHNLSSIMERHLASDFMIR